VEARIDKNIGVPEQIERLVSGQTSPKPDRITASQFGPKALEIILLRAVSNDPVLCLGYVLSEPSKCANSQVESLPREETPDADRPKWSPVVRTTAFPCFGPIGAQLANLLFGEAAQYESADREPVRPL